MKLHRLTLRNFCQFRGEQTIDFFSEGVGNISIVVADHGQGKTTLVNAIRWALFGTEGFSKDFPNTKFLSFQGYRGETPPSKNEAPEVALEFSIGGKLYQIKRHHYISDTHQESPCSRLSIVEPSGRAVSGDAAESFLNNLFPADLYRPFMLAGWENRDPFDPDFVGHLLRCSGHIGAKLDDQTIAPEVIILSNRRLREVSQLDSLGFKIRINQIGALEISSGDHSEKLTRGSFGSSTLALISILVLNAFRFAQLTDKGHLLNSPSQGAPLVLDDPFSMSGKFHRRILCEAIENSPHQSIIAIYPRDSEDENITRLVDLDRAGSIFTIRSTDSGAAEIVSNGPNIPVQS